MELKKISENPVYHFEYVAVQNQRIALVRIRHIYYQIGYASSVVAFGTILNAAKAANGSFDPLLSVVAVVAGITVLILAFYLSRRYHKGIRNLYPRIIALELILDYGWFREYLRKHTHKYYKEFVEECETAKGESTTSEQMWDRVRELWKLKANDKEDKGTLPEHVRAAVMISIIYLLVVFFTICGAY
ncbi:MAG: hypothetical protein ACFFC1_20310 [Promethearchaeota archaeon]